MDATARASPESPARPDALYWEVTCRILEAVARGVVPWRKPWGPRNAYTGRPYKGINTLLLNLADYTDPRWVTANQAHRMGGTVRDLAAGTQIVTFWRRAFAAPNGSDQEPTATWGRRFHTVYNVTECEIPQLPPWSGQASAGEAVSAAASMVAEMNNRPSVSHGADAAGYLPREDRVAVPAACSFVSQASYYATLFHELAHSTGHPTRLNRRAVAEPDRFSSDRYAQEELVAELASAFVCAALGLDGSEDRSAAYVGGWLSALRRDRKRLLVACALAQRAADYIRGVRPAD